MNTVMIHLLRLFRALMTAALVGVAAGAMGASVVSWGGGQGVLPSGLSRIAAISSSVDHTLALTDDGSIVAWGFNADGQCQVPAGLGGARSVAAGAFFSLALRSDGSVVGWGDNQSGQCDIPAGLNTVTAISAGRNHGLALRSDGTLVAWGDNSYGQCDIPPGLNDVSAVVAGWNYSLALRSNGVVVAWGANDSGQTDIPPGLSNVTAVAASIDYVLALLSDQTVIGWGRVPVAPLGLGGVVAIAAGEDHALALDNHGVVTAWGEDSSGQTDVPSTLTQVTRLAAGWNYSLALAAPSLPPQGFRLTNLAWTPSGFSLSLNAATGKTYVLEYTDSLEAPTWISLGSAAGENQVITVSDPAPADSHRFYRVREQ
jgi:alpha-tubulin suppressor-like RCC1 family protein